MKRVALPIFLCIIFTISSLPIPNSSAESVDVCCDSTPVELFLIGPSGSGELSPFTTDLLDDPESQTITNSIAQQTEIASWEINPSWAGSYPSSTWEFQISYELENAGGAQINATVTVEIGGDEYTGSTDQSNSFLTTGSGTLSIDVEVDSGSVPSASKVKVTLSAQTIVFTVPGSDAVLEFFWGSNDHESSITADIPIVDLIVDEPVTEGMDVYVSVTVASPFGQKTAAHANSLGIRVNSQDVAADPIQTSNGDFVRLTWTWTATTEGEQIISIEAFIQIQSSTPIRSGITEFTIYPVENGGGGSGGFYPDEEPLRSDGVGSHLAVNLEMSLDTEDDYLVMRREISLGMDQEIAYWIRWGLDNIGTDDSSLSTAISMFSEGMVSDDDRRNRKIDGVEVNEFQNQLASGLATTYMYEGLDIELEELLGTDFSELESARFSIDLQGETRVIPHPILLKISTVQIMKDNSKANLLRDFVRFNPQMPTFKSYDLNIEIQTSMFTSLTAANLKGEDNLDLTQRRTPFGETITLTATDISPRATFVIEAFPSTNPLNAPISLTIVTIGVILAGLFFSLKLTKTKKRTVVWVEMSLVPVILVALYLAYEPFIIGVLSTITAMIWVITAVASPKSKQKIAQIEQQTYPSIDCPACDTPNMIMSQERPYRMPCSGCSRVLKIVE
jgi:hypothetical protein